MNKTPESWDDVASTIYDAHGKHVKWVSDKDLFARKFVVEVKLEKHGKPVITWYADCKLPQMTLEEAQALGAEVFGGIYKNQHRWEE